MEFFENVMEFSEVSTEQAMVILSHFRAIGEVLGRSVEAFVQGTASTEKGEPVFLQSRARKVLNLPTRKYFTVMVDGVEMRVKFDEVLDLTVRF